MSNTRGEALKKRRQDKRLTQQALSDKSGVDQVTISDIERNRTKSTSWDKVAALSVALECDPADLFTLPGSEVSA